MVRANTDFNSENEEEGSVPDDELPMTQSLEVKEKEENEADGGSKWVAFSNPAPFVIKARFNITEIEVPSGTEAADDDKEKDNTFLQMLIKEGIPVNYLSEEQTSEEPSNVGVILSASDPIAEETLNYIPQSQEMEGSEDSVNQVDNIIEVTGCSKPISKPLFLQLVPSQSSLQEGNVPGSPETERRRGSTDPTIIFLPPETTTLPVKKKVRFDLPGRKASLIGEYEILNTPVSAYSKRSKKRSRSSSNNRQSHTSEESSENDDEQRPSRRKKIKSRRHFRLMEDVVNSSSSEYDTKEENEGYFLRLKCDPDVNDPNEDDLGDTSDNEEFEVDIQCGLRSWTPEWLQIFARNECYLVVFCIVALAQGMLYTYNIAIISTVQRRFHMSSAQTGFIFSGNDISQIMISVFVAFYGTYGNRPKWLGIGAMGSAFAALVAASPHMFFGSGEFAEQVVENPDEAGLPQSWMPKTLKKLELCGFEMLEDCSNNSTSFAEELVFYVPLILLSFSQLLVGVANSIFWTVGVSYLDDNVSKKKTSFHIALFTIARVVGPALGYILGGFCLSFWIDPTQDVNITLPDPRWIGAWWLGFLFLSILIGVPGFFYFCFPRQMPQKNKRNYYIQSPLHHINGENNVLYKHKSASFDELSAKRFLYGIPSIKELPKGLKRLLNNKIWTANVFSNVFFVLAMSGHWTFKPKYLQIQFWKSTSSANFYTGMTTMIASVIGITISGVVMRWIRPRTSYVTGYNVFLTMYAIVSLFALMTIHCPSNEIAGHLPGQEKWDCSEHCNCSETFSPVCAEDGVTTFYSPCFAGCTLVNLYASPVEYLNCTCFGKRKFRWQDTVDEASLIGYEIPSYSFNEGWALDGYCPDNCNAFTIYLIIQLVNKVVFATGRIGGTLVNLRAVNEKDKTLALGCLAVFVSFAGFIPASFVMGWAIDSACLAWNKKCGKLGSCSFYDSDKFRLVVHVIPAALLVVSGIGDLIVHVNNSSLSIYGEPIKKDEPDLELEYNAEASKTSRMNRVSQRT